MNKIEPVPLFSAEKANAGLDFTSSIQRVLTRHWYILGDEVKYFEAEFAEYVGTEHCITVGNGSDALELALRALNVLPGESVLTVANAGFYGSTAIHAVGAIPLYVDIDPCSMTVCVKRLEEVLDKRPAAVIITHLFGQLANIEEIVEICQELNIPILEDCAQAHGAQRNGKKAGSFGDIACFSFYPTKNLGALGDGGAVLTNDAKLAGRIRQLRQYGWSQKYHVSLPGGRNSRMDEIQAAILRTKLPHLDSWNRQRRLIAKRFNEAFASFDIILPASVDEDFVAHLYVIRVSDRIAFAKALKAREVNTDIHYPVADHLQPAYPTFEISSLPVTERACESVVSLPCFPGLTDDEIQRVINAVADYFSGAAKSC